MQRWWTFCKMPSAWYAPSLPCYLTFQIKKSNHLWDRRPTQFSMQIYEPSPSLPHSLSQAHSNRAGDCHFLDTLKIYITSFLPHSLQPPHNQPSNLSLSARPAIASLWGLCLPYLSYLGDWQTYVLWYIIYEAWLEAPFPLKMSKALL